jgi:endoglucanase
MARFVAQNGYPPEFVNILTGSGPKPGPSGFSAAMLPFLRARGDRQVLEAQLNRLQAKPIRPKAYYEQALGLFGLGAHDGYFRFAQDGRLLPKWQAC